MVTTATPHELLPAAIAAGRRAFDRATKLKLPDGKPEPLGLATLATLTPATLAVLLLAAEQLQAMGAQP